MRDCCNANPRLLHSHAIYEIISKATATEEFIAAAWKAFRENEAIIARLKEMMKSGAYLDGFSGFEPHQKHVTAATVVRIDDVRIVRFDVINRTDKTIDCVFDAEWTVVVQVQFEDSGADQWSREISLSTFGEQSVDVTLTFDPQKPGDISIKEDRFFFEKTIWLPSWLQ